MQPVEVFKSWVPTICMGAAAITLYPFIFYACSKDEAPTWLINHERFHFYEIQDVGVVRWYTSYLLYYFAGLAFGKGHAQSYLDIPHEQRARQAERT